MLSTTCCCNNWQPSIAATLIFVIVLSISTFERNICSGMEVYFPLSDVHLNLPINEKSQSIFSKIPIVRFQALLTSNNNVAENYIYSLEKNSILDINSTTGEVFMKNDYATMAATVDKVNVIITVIPKTYNGNKAHVKLEIKKLDENKYCENLENICFWSAAHFQLVEDSHATATTNISHQSTFKPIVVAALNARGARYLCPSMDIKYTLEDGSDFFQIINNNVLSTRVPLDHEALNLTNGNSLQAAITCLVNISKNNTKTYRRILNITLVDRNDNGPELQNNKTIKIRLADPHFKMNNHIGDKIIFIDRDNLETNAHLTYIIRNDTNDLVRPVCNAYETDHTGKRNTVISCQLVFARNGLLGERSYCFSLEARDETIVTNNHTSKKVSAHVCLLSDPAKIHEADRPRAMPLRQNHKSHIMDSDESLLQTDNGGDADDGAGLQSSFSMQIFSNSYPKNVYVNRTAKPFYRITQPNDFINLMSRSNIKFHIAEDRSRAFGITTLSGIIYVKDAVALEKSLETVYFLNITWHDNHQRSFVINVHLINDTSKNVGMCENRMKRGSQTCAQLKVQAQCEKFCGLATGGAGCMWRGTNAALLSQTYASCVPDPKYCPDHICDPLEELNQYACPQDCTASNQIMGPHSANDNKRGIYSASGTCICEDNGKCSCKPLLNDNDDFKGKNKRKRKNGMEHKTGKLESTQGPEGDVEMSNAHANEQICGRSCMLIAAICPIVVILLIICLLISRRNLQKRVNSKTATTKSNKEQTNEDQHSPNCDNINNADVALINLHLSEGFKFTIDDLKWEFARDKLVLDTVLGEGEFGKVMKGYATDIAGFKGVSTVAVKMLKTGANSVEYAALLSEFQLLQEVSHPNVIKLLGACTKGDTPMIIIEYARYGSLRSYLRLSRKIAGVGAEFSDGIDPISVKDILSFAWQICKGMAYLTEIKLVHRDLAARNVLLADNKICKISDFGLTRDIYEDDAYLKQSRDRVPVKWMAPESLADHVYTTKTDVWAFGVLCWEIINLGASPYPGVPPQNLYHLLKCGYRMERPEHCSEEIYGIVRSCWAADPNARPSFKYLASQLEKLLGNNAKYIELETHAISNPMYCVDEEEDFSKTSQSDLTKLVMSDFGDPDCLDHLWRPPCDAPDGTNSREFSLVFSGSDFVPPGYDMPRPLIEASSTGQALRYENDLRFPLNIRKSVCNADSKNGNEMYAVPVKRGRSYIDMTNRRSLIPDNLDNKDFEKHISKTISFRFSSLLNLKEQQQDDAV